MEERAQISFEYLLMATFAIMLVIVATVAAMNLKGIADAAQSRIIQYRDRTIAYLMS